MQSTRQHILEILRENGQATVAEIVEALSDRVGDITAVTVRHHLEVLRGKGLITAPSIRRKNTPGRPQHVYALADKALDLFPHNYRNLASELLFQIKANLSSDEVTMILEGTADQIASGFHVGNLSMPARLERIVEYLTEQGYNAHWESSDDGYVLHASHCPYHHLVKYHQELCEMDFRLVSNLLGVTPQKVGSLSAGQGDCSYLIPFEMLVTAK